MAIFRQSALEKHEAAEVVRADSLGVVYRQTNIAAVVLGALLLASLSWGVLGRVPETGQGPAILVTKGSVRAVQAKAGGQVAQWFVKVGDEVEAGQALGLLDQPVIERELEQSREKLREIEERNRDLGGLRDKFAALEKKSFEAKAERLTARIFEMKRYIQLSRSFSQRVKKQSAQFHVRQLKNLESAKQAEEATAVAFKKRMTSYERLRVEGLAAEDSVRAATRSYEDSQLRIKDLALRRKELAVSQLRVDEAYQQARSRIASRENEMAELELQLKELDNRKAKLEKKQHEDRFSESNESQELKRSIARFQARLERERTIKAPLAGRVLELTAVEGSMVSLGARIMQLDTRQASDPLVALAFFSPAVGKRLQVGARVRVSPSTASRSVHGSIWGEVRSVSAYPVTAAAVSHHIGNQGLAEQLLRGGHSMEVEVELLESKESFSGYRWTSKGGPRMRFTAGTQADVTVTLERRRPLSYVMPALRSLVGG